MSDTPALRRAVLEAIVLPFVFLTVAAAGGFRLTTAGEVRLLPPGLFSLVLATLLLGALLQAGIVQWPRLAAEPGGASLSAAVLFLSVAAATTQILNGLVPERGLSSLLFNLFFAVLLSNTLAAQPTPPRLLRSLAVTFSWALLMKYVFLAGLAAPPASLTAQVVAWLARGAAGGSLPVDVWSPAVGYVMFGASVLYLVGLVSLTQMNRVYWARES